MTVDCRCLVVVIYSHHPKGMVTMPGEASKPPPRVPVEKPSAGASAIAINLNYCNALDSPTKRRRFFSGGVCLVGTVV
jgi:hypothetical protein